MFLNDMLDLFLLAIDLGDSNGLIEIKGLLASWD